MRTLLLAFCAAAFTSVANAQITITDADFPVAGDFFFVSQALDFEVDFTTTGPNTNWDFSGLSPNGQVYREYIPMSQASGLVTLLFGSFAPVNYQASYFNEATNLPIDQIGTFLPIPLENIYQFYRKTSSGITSIGYSMEVSGQGIPAKSDTIETMYEFPLNYQDEYFSHGYTDLDLDPLYDAAWIQHRTHAAYVDGWGQITTPYGTFDALRVQHFITESDSINFQGMWFGIPVPDSYVYEWLANGEKEPVLRIRTSDIGGTEVVTAIEYKDYFQPSLGVQEVVQPEFNVYPNPTQETIQLSFNAPAELVVVYAPNGSQAARIEHPETNVSIDVKNWQSATYLVVISFADGKSKLAPFVKQ